MHDDPVIVAADCGQPPGDAELRDRAQQQLFGVALLLHALEAELPPGSPQRVALAGIRHQVGQALENLAEVFSSTPGSASPLTFR